MAYAQRKELTGNRTVSIVMTALVVGGLMFAIVTGLAYNVIKKSVQDLTVIDVKQPPPPPDEPPPPPKDMPKVPPPPMTPPPLVQTKTQPPPIQTVAAPPVLPPVAPPVMAPPAPPPPPAPAHKVQSAISSKGSLASLFTEDDYPASALSSGAEGTAQASITIGPDGRVVGCNITRSSGNSALDAATCNVIRRRAKFTPARDSNGNPTTDTQSTPPIVWRLQG